MRKPIRPRRHRTLRTIGALILREMQTTYGRTAGGYVWAILEPAGGITILTIVISIGLNIKAPSLGSSFALFYATGLVPFTMMVSMMGRIGQSIAFSRPLLAYPSVTYMDAIIARFLLNVLTQLIVFLVVMTGVHVLLDVSTIRNYSAIAGAFGLAIFFAVGLGVLNCLLFALVPVWQKVWVILNKPMFLISTIIFTFEEIPAEYRDYLWFNPYVHVIGMMRRGFYATYDAAFVSPIYVVVVSATCLVLGLLGLARFHRDILNA